MQNTSVQTGQMNNGNDVFAGQRAVLEMESGMDARPLKKVARVVAGPAVRSVIAERRQEDVGAGIERLSPDAEMEKEEELQLYVHAALCFVHALLGIGDEWSDADVRKALRDLEIFFRNTKDQEGAFVTLAQRVIVANIIAGNMERLRLWDCLMHPSGLCSEPRLGYSRQQDRAIVKKSPMFSTGLPILIRYYLKYVKEPSADLIMRMKSELDNVEFGELMQIFYEVVNAGEVGV